MNDMRAKRFYHVWLSSILLGCCVLWSCSLGADGFKVYLSEQQLQQAVAKHFPLEKSALLGQLKAEIRDPRLSLLPDQDRMALTLHTELSAGKYFWPGTLQLSFGLDYRADKTTIYLTAPQVDKVTLTGLPEAMSEAFTQNILPLMLTHLGQIAFYQLDEDTSREKLLKQTLKQLQIEKQRVVLTFALL